MDLAGSEQLKKTGAVDLTAEQAKVINVSLLTLGKVVTGMGKGCGWGGIFVEGGL